MILSDVATIRVNFPEADFWLVRRGSLKTVGKPVDSFYSEHIGIKVTRTDLLLPRFLWYCMEHLHKSNQWEQLATGTLELVNIRISDVKNIRLRR